VVFEGEGEPGGLAGDFGADAAAGGEGSNDRQATTSLAVGDDLAARGVVR
jgi:hypothetical protein